MNAPASSISPAASSENRTSWRLAERYQTVRQFTARLVQMLSAEDCTVQSMPDVSPASWHLAHTTWFYETFVLAGVSGYRLFHPRYEYLFNSYYNAVGEQFPRPRRGLLTRPGLAEINAYRQFVDEKMGQLLQRLGDEASESLAHVIELGLQHEQQHQELILTDIKHVLFCNPLFPVYDETAGWRPAAAGPLGGCDYEEGIYEVGHAADQFAYDNELPCHRVFVETFHLANRPVTSGEYMEFIEDGGYRRPELWLSLGWQTVCEQRWQAPLYWMSRDGGWSQFTLAGLRDVDRDSPVCHVSYFEADAFARWAGARLPTEAEWEIAAETVPLAGNFVDTLLAADAAIHPGQTKPVEALLESDAPSRMFGDVWEWTASPYTAYPGYRPPSGALGEYNGKFMCNQYVLRGGSVATSQNHIRRTYRNFFPPASRWQFMGLRLAR